MRPFVKPDQNFDFLKPDAWMDEQWVFYNLQLQQDIKTKVKQIKIEAKLSLKETQPWHL